MTPLLKWPGGKARLSGVIWELLQTGLSAPPTLYLEPFFGGGGAFLGRPEGLRSVVSDTNERLVHFHTTVQLQLEPFLEVLDVYREIGRGDYARIRTDFNRAGATGVEQAVRLLWLNKMGYNGLYRENRRGDYNVPVGTGSALPTEAAVRAYAQQLQGTTILALPFSAILASAGPGTIVYLDPPYLGKLPSSFTSYSAGGFGWQQHVELRAGVDAAIDSGSRVLLSGSANPATTEIYLGGGSPLRIARELNVSRSIGARAGSRGKTGEYLLVGGGW